MKFFENRKIKGAISIFLVMILLPTMLFSAVLIDGSRMASARAMTQEAADLAAASALASYNQDLKDDYGLFAINDNSKVEEIYRASLDATLMACGFSGNEDYSERIWEILKSQAGFGNPYKGKSFLNLYDFSVDSCTVSPMYSLANYQVLENQMVEHAKFRGIYVMADRFDILSNLGDMKKQAEKNEVSCEVMEDKMQVDEDNGDVEKALAELREAIEDLNSSIIRIQTYRDDYIKSLSAKMEVIKFDNIDTDETLERSIVRQAASYGSDRSKLKGELGKVDDYAKKVIQKAEKSKEEVERAIERLEGFKNENSGKASANEEVGDMIGDADKTISDYREHFLPDIQKILDEQTLNRLKDDKDLGRDMGDLMEEIDDAIHAYEEEISRMQEEEEEDDDEDDGDEEEEEEEITEYYYYYLGLNDKTTEGDQVLSGSSASRSYKPAVNQIISYFLGKQWNDEINPTLELAKGGGTSVISEDFASSQSGRETDQQDSDANSQARQEIKKAVYDMRPSVNFDAGAEAESIPQNSTGFYNRDGDLSGSKSILENGKSSMILDLGETARDDILCLSYMFGTFKTRLTGVGKFSSEGIAEADKTSFYMPEWRGAHQGGELDMRFTPKKDRKTVLRSEIEYLICGGRTDRKNEDTVYAAIFAERLANNMGAMYLEKKVVRPACHMAAAAACTATGGLVPEIVFFWIFLTAWATAETYIEMDYLVSGGYKVPFFKTKDNILLNKIPDESGEKLISNYGTKGVFVSYEDYLLILLVLKGEQKRLMRSADLIEMNMKEKQSEFSMAQAFTYLRADTDMSIRYLFGSVAPFRSEYEKNGVTGRMKFSSMIDQGY